MLDAVLAPLANGHGESVEAVCTFLALSQQPDLTEVNSIFVSVAF